MNLGFDLWIDADGTGHQIPVERVTRFFSRDQTAIDLFLQDGVVVGQGHELLTAQTIQARIANMRDDHLVIAKDGATSVVPMPPKLRLTRRRD
jgi:hypothetical protein